MRGRGRSTRSKAIPSAYIWAENGIAWRQRQARSLKAIRLRASMYPFCRRTCLALCSASVTRARINVLTLVGGIRGLGELEKRANSDMLLAFSMCPTTLEELMAIADAGKVMPPKSTWFEPKLLSGLFIHKLKE